MARKRGRQRVYIPSDLGRWSPHPRRPAVNGPTAAGAVALIRGGVCEAARLALEQDSNFDLSNADKFIEQLDGSPGHRPHHHRDFRGGYDGGRHRGDDIRLGRERATHESA